MSDSRPAAVPSVVSFLVCDQVIDDKLTGKKSAIGIFNAIMVPRMPAAINRLAILASVTELTGRVELELRLVRDADYSVLFSGKGHVEAPDPLAVVDLIFALQGVRVPAEGQYAFELLCAGEILGRRRFRVKVRPPGEGPPGAPGEPGPQTPYEA